MVIGAEIPVEFLFESGFTELNWQQIYHQNALSAIYLGTKEKPTSPIKFSDSEAVIAIHSDVNNQRQIEAKRVEMSGIVADSKKRERAFSISYNTKLLNANSCFISIADNEKSEFSFYDNPNRQEEKEARLMRIPIDPEGYFFTPNKLLISTRMSQIVLDTKMINVDGPYGQSYYTSFQSFFVDLKENNMIIGRKESHCNSSWNVSLPASLIPSRKN